VALALQNLAASVASALQTQIRVVATALQNIVQQEVHAGPT